MQFSPLLQKDAIELPEYVPPLTTIVSLILKIPGACRIKLNAFLTHVPCPGLPEVVAGLLSIWTKPLPLANVASPPGK
jgi:hypothetical protein